MGDRVTSVEFSENAYEDYRLLQNKVLEDKERGLENSFNIQLLKTVNRERDNLKIDPQHGTYIPRKYIPRGAILKYGTDRLWKIDLVGFWRLIYTITGDSVKVIAFVLEFMDHDKYNKIFGYKKRWRVYKAKTWVLELADMLQHRG